MKNQVALLIEAFAVSFLPSLLIRFWVADWLFRLPQSAYLSSAVSAMFGVWFCLHAGLSISPNGSFNPYAGIVPVFLSELYVRMETEYNLAKDGAEQHGERYILPNGTVIRVPNGVIPTALAAALFSSWVLYNSGSHLISSGLIAFLHRTPVVWISEALGCFTFLSLMGLLARWSRTRAVA